MVSNQKQMTVNSAADVLPDGPVSKFVYSLKGTGGVSIFPFIFVISLIIPVFFYAGTLRLAPFLVILMVLLVPMFIMLVTGHAGPMILPDFLVVFYCAWSTLSLMVVHGVSEAVEPMGIIWIQTLGAYLVGRVFVRNINGLKVVLYLYSIMVLFIFPFALIETATTRTVYLEFFSKFGIVYDSVVMEPRWGFDRVQGAFEHPILYGIFSVSLFSLVYYGLKPLFLRLVVLAAIIVSGFISLSTGAILCMAVQSILITWNWLFKNNPKRWRNLTILVIVCYIIIDLISNRSPFHVFVDYLTFNSGSAYNRILIWKFGSAEVWRHPVFGIGFNEWIRPWYMSPSMDNFWLVHAVRYGIPSFLALTASYLIIMTRAGKIKDLVESDRNLRDGLMTSFVGIMVAICSVHMWNATFCWFMFIIGSSVFFLNGTLEPKPGAAEPSEEPEVANSNPVSARLDNSQPQSLKAIRAASSVNRARTLPGGGRSKRP